MKPETSPSEQLLSFQELCANEICFTPVWWPEVKNSPNVAHAWRKRRLKRAPSAWGYSWATRAPEGI
jgi:hypothetical protein